VCSLDDLGISSTWLYLGNTLGEEQSIVRWFLQIVSLEKSILPISNTPDPIILTQMYMSLQAENFDNSSSQIYIVLQDAPHNVLHRAYALTCVVQYTNPLFHYPEDHGFFFSSLFDFFPSDLVSFVSLDDGSDLVPVSLSTGVSWLSVSLCHIDFKMPSCLWVSAALPASVL
jgi:hypothetical protein